MMPNNAPHSASNGNAERTAKTNKTANNKSSSKSSFSHANIADFPESQANKKHVIAVDAMGGDGGTKAVVAGVKRALKRSESLHVILVGKQKKINKALEKRKLKTHPRIAVLHASEVIASDESPSAVLRSKKDASMRIAIQLVADKVADACISSGNTGALMVLGRFILKMLPGIDRPAICSAVPNKHGHVHWLDLGANIDSSPEQLLQFGLMGSALSAVVDSKDEPTVGLLNVGSENIKGNETVKNAHDLFEQSPLNYVGFVEGNDIYTGKQDVIVCDGFIGNIALKASEGLAKMISDNLKNAFVTGFYAKIAALVAMPMLRRFAKSVDPRAYNGASLLGLSGIVIKSHGGADKKAFANALRIAELEVEKQLPNKIKAIIAEQMAKLSPENIQAAATSVKSSMTDTAKIDAPATTH